MYVWKWTNDKQTKRFVQRKLIKYTILLLYHLSLSYPPPLYCLNPCRIQCCTYWIVPFLNFDSFVVHPNRSLDLTSRSLGCSDCTTISNRDQPPNQSLSSNKQFIQNKIFLLKLLQWNNVFKYILFFPSESFQRLSLRCIKSALLHGCGKNDQACHLNIIIEHQLEWKATANRRNFPIGVFQLVMAVKATTSWSVADLINFSLPDFYSLTKIKEVRRVKSDIFLDIVGFNRIVQQMMQNWIIVIKIKKV